MAQPTISALSETQMTVSWVALVGTATGNSAITSYNLYWDNGSGTTNVQAVDSLVTSFQVTGLTGGTAYKFKVRAKNIYGEGAFSTELSQVASDVPDQPSAVTVAIDGTNVKFTWTAPGANNAAIDSYEIVFLQSDTTYALDATNCDASAGLVFTNRECSFAMTTHSANTGLTVGTLIKAKVRAHNANGWGPLSEPNTSGASIETIPLQMATPTFDAATSTNTQIDLEWTALSGASAGGTTITNYKVEMFNTGTISWDTIATTASLTHTESGLIGGTSYRFRVSATNKYGTGPVSPEATIVAA